MSALEWAEIRTLARDGVSQREIERRLGINRRTVVRALGPDAPPRMCGRPAVRSWIGWCRSSGRCWSSGRRATNAAAS